MKCLTLKELVVTVLPWRQPVIRYYAWEGDACRVYRDPDGDLKADLYIAGSAKLWETDPTSVTQGSRQIHKAEYEDMIRDKDEHYRRLHPDASDELSPAE